jgi:hypothetical protein
MYYTDANVTTAAAKLGGLSFPFQNVNHFSNLPFECNVQGRFEERANSVTGMRMFIIVQKMFLEI